jgi:RNA polymerase sigma-70 factor (ECF subfamily)
LIPEDSSRIFQGIAMDTFQQVSDTELVEGIQQEDPLAFEELVNRYSTRVFTLANRVTKHREDAEDVMQEVFISVMRKIEAFRGQSSCSSWIYRVTLNCALMKLRKRRQDKSMSMEEMLSQVLAVPNKVNVFNSEGESFRRKNELREALTAAINSLPRDYRPVFILRDVDGFSSIEVSEMLGISVPAVKSRLHRSRLALQRTLTDMLQSDAPEDLRSVQRRAVG